MKQKSKSTLINPIIITVLIVIFILVVMFCFSYAYANIAPNGNDVLTQANTDTIVDVKNLKGDNYSSSQTEAISDSNEQLNLQTQALLSIENNGSENSFSESNENIRETDVDRSDAGEIIVYVDANYSTMGSQSAVARLNQLRYEACAEGVRDPRNPSKNLTMSDYVPIKWSTDMEWIAQTRAAEACFVMDHVRPTGKDCFTCTHNDHQSWAEVLAWNYSGMAQGIEQWYSEKHDWVHQTGGVTGHYTSMINPNNFYFGLGTSKVPTNGYYTTAGEFSSEKNLTETETSEKGQYKQAMAFRASQFNYNVSYPTSMEAKSSSRIGAMAIVKNYPSVQFPVKTNDLDYSSSNPNVAEVNEYGYIISKNPGTTTIKVYKADTLSGVEYKLTVTPSTRPEVSVVAEGDGYADVEWDPIEGATKYAIAEMENGSYKNYTTEWKGTTYHCDNLANGYEHYILVQAYVNGKWSNFDSSNYCSVFPDGPTKPTTSVSKVTDRSITLSWNKVAGSTEYAAAVKSVSGEWKTVFVGKNITSATIDGLTDSSTYKCLVQCKIYGAWSSFTEVDFVSVTTKGNRPVPREVKSGDGYADIEWDAIPGATAYAIATMENGKYKNYSITCPDTSYHCDNLANGYGHYLLVQAYVDGNWSPFSKDNYLLVNVDGPTKKPTTTVSGTTDSSATVTWNMVPGASEYAVALRDPSGKYISQYFKVDSSKTYPSTATFNGLKDGINYKAIVQSKIFGTWSSFTEAEMVDAKTTSNRPVPWQTAIGDGYADIAWNPIPGATKYAIAEMENGKYRNYTTEWTDTTYHCDDLANGYGHYILVQAYVNGKWTNFDSSNYLLVTPQGATKPAPTVASTTSSSITLSWAKVAGAKQYAAAVRLDDGSYKTVVVGKDTTTATIEGLQPGKTYKCLVQCQIYGAWSSFTESDLVTTSTKN